MPRCARQATPISRVYDSAIGVELKDGVLPSTVQGMQFRCLFVNGIGPTVLFSCVGSNGPISRILSSLLYLPLQRSVFAGASVGEASQSVPACIIGVRSVLSCVLRLSHGLLVLWR